MKLLSIIVPIYNVEPYVEKCIRSIQTQDIPADDYEIICINDGSPDDSREIVLRLQNEFVNIVLIDQENQGVSRARNNGIERASGRYLLFIDPDDFIQDNSLDHILKTVASKDAQIGICGYTFLDQYGNIQGTRTYDHFEEQVFTGIEAYFLIRENRQIQPDLSVGIIYRADFLNNNCLRYLPGIPFLEDGEFLARVHSVANRCIFVNGQFYMNYARPGSATHSTVFSSEKARNGFQHAASNLKRFQLNQSLNEKQKLSLNQPIMMFVFRAILSALHTRSIYNYWTTLKNLKVLGLNKLILKGCVGYYPICGKLYNFSPHFGAFALVLYLKLNNLYQSFLFRRNPTKRDLNCA